MFLQNLELSQHKRKVARLYNLTSRGYDRSSVAKLKESDVQNAQANSMDNSEVILTDEVERNVDREQESTIVRQTSNLYSNTLTKFI